jgi:outer membrane protein assembly factor BamB
MSLKWSTNTLCVALFAVNFASAQQRISVESVQAESMQPLWKMKLNGSPTPPAVAARLITYKGFKDLLFVGTNTDNVVAIDHALGKVFWDTHLPYDSLLVPVKNGTATCPAGMTAAVTLVPAAPAAPRPPGPVPTLPRPKKIPAAVYALSSDGLIHTLNQHTGGDLSPALRFIRGNAKAQDLLAAGNIVYAVTADKCGGAPNGVWSINVESTLVSEWKTGDASALGLAIGSDTLFATTTTGIAALDPKTLAVKQQQDGPFDTHPLVFKFKDKEYVAAGNTSGHVFLLDAVSLAILVNIPGHGIKLGSVLASWEDEESKARRILAAWGNKIVSFKVGDENGAPALQQEWSSRELVSPAPPIVINGVVFALSSGSPGVPAVLYALDGTTGKELWNSGKGIAGYSTTGISAGAGKIFVGTQDGMLYAFGSLMNRE